MCIFRRALMWQSGKVAKWQTEKRRVASGDTTYCLKRNDERQVRGVRL